jgi:hypothetical protein
MSRNETDQFNRIAGWAVLLAVSLAVVLTLASVA